MLAKYGVFESFSFQRKLWYFRTLITWIEVNWLVTLNVMVSKTWDIPWHADETNRLVSQHHHMWNILSLVMFSYSIICLENFTFFILHAVFTLVVTWSRPVQSTESLKPMKLCTHIIYYHYVHFIQNTTNTLTTQTAIILSTNYTKLEQPPPEHSKEWLCWVIQISCLTH
jgi:hypothetical protein